MKKNWKKVLVGTLCLVGFLLLLVKGNQFEKVSLISTEGQSYEKAVVTKITKDNLAEDGNRYGTQEVRVQVKSGAYAGEEVVIDAEGEDEEAAAAAIEEFLTK